MKDAFLGSKHGLNSPLRKKVVLKDVKGRETVYSKSEFDPNHDGADLVESLVEKLERALGSNVRPASPATLHFFEN